jgi:hypothetical protein
MRQVRAKPEEFVRGASRAVLGGRCITCRAVLLLEVPCERSRRQQGSQLRCHAVTKTYFLHYLPPEGAAGRACMRAAPHDLAKRWALPRALLPLAATASWLPQMCGFASVVVTATRQRCC